MAERSTFDADELANLVADRARPASERTRLGGAGALVAAVALVAFPGGHGVVAVLGGLVVLAAWYLLAPTYAFALGHVALAAVLPAETFAQGADLAWLAAVEAGLVGILLASATRIDRFGDETGSRSASRTVVGLGLVLGWVVLGVALAWASAGSALGLPAAGGVVVVAAALAAYGLHRYQLVSLGLVDDGAETDAGADGGGTGGGDYE